MHILFPYLARFKSVNWTRYHHIFCQLAEMGHRITVLQPPPANLNETNFQEIDVELPDSIKLIDVPMPGWLWKHRWPLDKLVKKGSYGLLCRRKVREIFETDPPDALLVYNLPQEGMLRIAPRPDRPLVRVFDLADDYEAMLVKELGPLACGPLIYQGRRILHRMLGEADRVLAISRTLATDYSNWQIHLLPNGVDLDRFSAARESAERHEGPPVIGYLGAFEYFIDFDMILEMAALLPEYRFRLIGSGREQSSIEERIAKMGLRNVELPGPVPFNRVPAEIARMDICLNLFERIPISHKACPMKLFEYLAMGKPVLTTVLDEIETYDADFLIRVRSAEEAAKAAKRLIEQPEEKARLAGEGLDWVSRGYDWRTLADQFLRLIEGHAGEAS
jgi:glycosyltransferase involved in cell wall biosynthesis